MWSNAFFPLEFFALGFWAKVGGTLTFLPAWAQFSNKTVGFGITAND